MNEFFLQIAFKDESIKELFNELFFIIFKHSLPYKRKNVIIDVLKRKKVRSVQEYDVVKDNLIAALQLGQINNDEFNRLNEYLTDFERHASV